MSAQGLQRSGPSTKYRCIVVDQNHLIGTFGGTSLQENADSSTPKGINAYIGTVDTEDYDRPAILLYVNFPVPRSLKLPHCTLSVEVRISAEDIGWSDDKFELRVQQVVAEDRTTNPKNLTLSSFPRHIADCDSVKRVLSLKKSTSNSSVELLSINIRPDRLIAKNLFSDDVLPSTEHQAVLERLREMFSADSAIQLIVYNFSGQFFADIQTTLQALTLAKQHGDVFDSFFTGQHQKAFKTLQYGNIQNPEDRAKINTHSTSYYANFNEFFVRQGVGQIQADEYAKFAIDNIMNHPHYCRFLDTGKHGGGIHYLAFMEVESRNCQYFKPGTSLQLKFDAEGYTDSLEPWRCQVVELASTICRTGEVALWVQRPKVKVVEDPDLDRDEQKHANMTRPYVSGTVPCGSIVRSTTSELRGEIDRAPKIKVEVTVEHSSLVCRRVIYALKCIAEAKVESLEQNVAQEPSMEDSPELSGWRDLLPNRTSIPESKVDILGFSVKHLTGLDAADHQRCIKHLQQAPTIKGKSVACIEGFAGTGKTRFLAEVLVAMARDGKKFLVVTPSNFAADEISSKISTVLEREKLDPHMVTRTHNAETERKYTQAYAISKADKPNSKNNDNTDQQPAATSAAATSAAATFSVATSAAITSAAITSAATKSAAVSYYHEDKPPITHELGDEPVADTSTLLHNGMMDPEAIQQDDLLNTAVEGYRIAMALSQLQNPAHTLVADKRFREVKASQAWAMLASAGVVEPPTSYARPDDFATYRELFYKFVDEGNNMSTFDYDMLLSHTKELQAFVISNTRILVTTASNSGSALLYNNFKDAYALVVDEASQLNVGELCIPIAHYRPNILMLFGDTYQLSPVVVGPNRSTGFLKDLESSALTHFIGARWRHETLDIQRRSGFSIMDVPYSKYYKQEAEYSSSARDPNEHPFTDYVHQVINKLFPTRQEKVIQSSPVVYLKVTCTIDQMQDQVTMSMFNLEYAAVTVSIIEELVSLGVPPDKIGVVTPYNAQKSLYKQAFGILAERFPHIRWSDIFIDTIDAYQGSERSIILVDSVVTNKAGFTQSKKRMLVATTRARDGFIFVGATRNLGIRNHERAEVSLLYQEADSRGLMRVIPANHYTYFHHAVKPPVRLTRPNINLLAAQGVTIPMGDYFQDRTSSFQTPKFMVAAAAPTIDNTDAASPTIDNTDAATAAPPTIDNTDAATAAPPTIDNTDAATAAPPTIDNTDAAAPSIDDKDAGSTATSESGITIRSTAATHGSSAAAVDDQMDVDEVVTTIRLAAPHGSSAAAVDNQMDTDEEEIL